jgi:flagellar biosynthesis/type III secretory pathway M-ring protein FliF/YscJ
MTKGEKTDEKSENYVATTKTNTRQIAMDLQPKEASVLMPRSFFIKQYKAETQTDKDPSAALLEPYIKSKSDRYKAIVASCLSLPSNDAVVIEAYADTVPQTTAAPQQAVGAVSMMLSGHAKEIALGVLALISLFMVSMMVRKSGPALAMAGGLAIADVGGGAGSTVDSLLAKAVGVKAPAIDPTKEVGEGRQSLDGVELDDEEVRQQQVMEQVSTLVKDNPDAAANLIKRWMNRT